MYNRTLFALILAVPFFLNCPPFLNVKTELEKIRTEAERLHKQAGTILSTSIRDAVSVSTAAIAEAFNQKFTIDREAVRFIAVSAATTLADDAVKTIVMAEAKKIDKVLGINRSEAVASILLNEYCYPALNDIIKQLIDYHLNRLDPAFTGDTAAPDIESIIKNHVGDFSLDDVLHIVQSFSTEKTTPDYFSKVAMNSVNTPSYCATRNWKDNGLVYQYRIAGNGIETRCGDRAWEPLSPLPFLGAPVSIAADNNRFMVQTDRHELWWYCVKDDQAKWSIDIMNTAVEFMSLKPVIGGELCTRVIPILAEVVDSAVKRASAIEHLENWQTLYDHGGSLAYWNTSCSLWTDAALSIDKLLLKAGGGASFTANDYAEWSRNAHKAGSWSNLLSWTSGGHTFYRGLNLVPETITDIAIGNWNGTVVTAYVLAEGKIWFLDEEIIQPEWKAIAEWNDKWALLGAKDYRHIANSPYPLDRSSTIDASNSVIAAVKKTGTQWEIYWLRWDYHQKDDFVYWPLDWCEHEWKSAICPRSDQWDFRISTVENIDPREHGTVWSVPAPAFTFHNYLPQEGYQGIFGDVPRELVSAYPVDLFIRNSADEVFTFSLKRSETLKKTRVSWRKP